MNTDCQWIDKNLEAFFSGTLSQEDQHRAQHHIANCGPCGKEVAALNSIDPLVKRHFDGELHRVQQGSPRRIAKSRLVAVSSVALLAACLILATALHSSRSDSNASSAVAIQAANSQSQPADTVASAKISDGAATAERSKPLDSTANVTVQAPRAAAAPDSNAPDFMVVDPAGYSRTLNDYRGYVFVLGILNRDQRDVISDFEHLYKQFGSNRRFRFLAVSSDRQVRVPNTTFPIAYNHGSKLFGALPGDFVLLDETGVVRLHGSLVKDLGRLETALQAK